MKWVRDRGGGDRLWMDDSEIEATAEGELHRADIYPNAEQPVVDLELLLESHLKVKLDQYADLPDDVFGLTEFEPGRPPRVMINGKLTEAADENDELLGTVGRWRATMAHEASHVIFHRILFELAENQEELFGGTGGRKEDRLFRCLKRQVAFGGGTDWREYQANRGMAALLMPRDCFREVVAQEMKRLTITGGVAAGSPAEKCLAEAVSGRFAVSRHATRIRLSTQGLAALRDQGVLNLR